MRRLLFALALLAPAAANAAIAFNAVGSIVTHSNATSVTLSAPAGVNPGDILIAVLGGTGASRSAQYTATAPAGSSWTLVKSQQDTAIFSGLYVFWAPSTETNFTFTTVQNTTGSTAVLAYTGVDNATPLDVAAVSQVNTSSTTETAPSISTTTTNTILVGAFLWSVTGTVALPTYSAEFGTHRQSGGQSGGRGGSASIDVADLAKAATGASGTKTVTTSSAQKSIGLLLALRADTTPPIPPLRGLMGVGK